MEQKRYKEGHFTGIGIAIGMPFGVAFGLVMGNIALGIAIGLSVGVSIGIAMEKGYNPNPIQLTDAERRIRNLTLTATLAIGVIVFIATFLIYSLR